LIFDCDKEKIKIKLISYVPSLERVQKEIVSLPTQTRNTITTTTTRRTTATTQYKLQVARFERKCERLDNKATTKWNLYYM